MNNPLNDGGGPSSNTGSSLGANPNGIGGFDGEVNPWGTVVPQNSDQTSSAPQNQEMDLDVDEEEQVSQLLNAPAFRIVIPGSQDPRSLFPERAAQGPGTDRNATANTHGGLLQTIRREIRATVQESVQSFMQDTVTAAFKDTVGDALAEYRHAVQTKEEDADDESDFPLSHSAYARRKKSKRENEYHNVLRGYLSSKGLWATEKGPLPQLPHAQEVEDFVTGRTNGPDLEDPRFDWTESFSHVWNDELLGMLAEDWISIIEEQIGPDELAEKYFDFDSVKRILVTKLRNTKSTFLRRYDHSTGEFNETDDVRQSELQSKRKSQLKSRHTSRAIGTYLRRSKIIKHFQHIGNDPEFWDAMEELIKALGRKGMSSDESEEEKPSKLTPYSRGRKVVRRVPLRWLRSEIAILWKYVEEHYRFIPASQKRGNPPYDRIFETEPAPALNMAVAQHLIVVKDLPTNWYDPLYWSHLTSQGKRSVSRVAPRPIPAIPEHDVNMNN